MRLKTGSPATGRVEGGNTAIRDIEPVSNLDVALPCPATWSLTDNGASPELPRISDVAARRPYLWEAEFIEALRRADRCLVVELHCSHCVASGRAKVAEA